MIVRENMEIGGKAFVKTHSRRIRTQASILNATAKSIQRRSTRRTFRVNTPRPTSRLSTTARSLPFPTPSACSVKWGLRRPMISKQKLRANVEQTKSDIKAALQLIFDSLNKGQQKKLIKNEEVHALLLRYGVIDD